MDIQIIKQALLLFENGESKESIHKILSIIHPKINKQNLKMFIDNCIDMMISLNTSVNTAGGCGYNAKKIEEISVLDLITRLATNRIRFIYTRLNHKEKLEYLISYSKEMKIEYSEQLKNDPSNILAGFAIDIYQEIMEEIQQ